MKQSSSQIDVSQVLSDIVRSHGIEHFGFTSLGKPLSLSFYKDWLNQGYAGEMNYLSEHLSQKENEKTSLLPTATSAIVIGISYFNHPSPSEKPLFQSLKIAKYARGNDYHIFLKEKLEDLVSQFKIQFPDEEFLTATDSSPVLERDLAYRAGLGWFGKNTCLIDQKHGSFFLIGEILTSLNLQPIREIHPDRCGTCNRCIEACPTQALSIGKNLDARKCISYLTIESKNPPQKDLRKGMHDWFFGCDICQDVCPWNEKAFSYDSKKMKPQSKRADILKDLTFILSSSKKELERQIRGLPFARSRGVGLKRNAIVVAANMGYHELKPLILTHATDPKLKDLVEWAVLLIDQ